MDVIKMIEERIKRDVHMPFGVSSFLTLWILKLKVGMYSSSGCWLGDFLSAVPHFEQKAESLAHIFPHFRQIVFDGAILSQSIIILAPHEEQKFESCSISIPQEGHLFFSIGC